MKQLIKLSILILLISSCSHDEGTEVIEQTTADSIKKLDMNEVGNNYDQLVLDIQSNQDLDFIIGDFNLEMRNMRPAEGITVENTIILEDEKDYRTIIIDHNTESIYVNYTDIDSKRNIVLYGFKHSDHLENLLKQKEYNIEFLTNRTSYKNRSSKIAKLDYISTETSFLMGKPILTTKKEQSQARIHDDNTKECGFQESEISDLAKESTILNRSGKTWNVIIYKKHSYLSTSSIVYAMKNTFKSLSITDGSDWYYSHIMYANINVIYEGAPKGFHNSDSLTCLNEFVKFLKDGGVQNNRSTNSYMYLNDDDWKSTFGRASKSLFGFRVGVSTNSGTTFAHEIGHTLGAKHYNGVVWDSSIGMFGWWGSSVMCPADETQWGVFRRHKYYSQTNRNKVRSTLN